MGRVGGGSALGPTPELTRIRGYALLQCEQMRAIAVVVVLRQKSHHWSPTLPFAHDGQIHAISLGRGLLQKSQRASSMRPCAQREQMRANAPRDVIL